MSHKIESTDVAPEVPYPRPTWDAASNAIARTSIRICVFFFFFFFLGFASTRLDSCQIGFDSRRIGFDSRRTGLIRPKSGRIDHIESYQLAAETGRKTAETCRKQSKSALNMAGKAETCLLLSFFVNQGIVCVF